MRKYRDLYDAVDQMDDFADDYYNTKADNRYLNIENKVLKEDNEALVGGIKSLNRVARRYRYSREDETQTQQNCNNANKPETKAMNNGCCPFNFNFKNITLGIGVLFLAFLALGITPETTISWASTKDMWIEFICDPYKIILVIALVLIYKNKRVQ